MPYYAIQYCTVPYRTCTVQYHNVRHHTIFGFQSISRDVADNVSPPYQLDPTMEIITFSFVLYLQHDRHDAKCKPLTPYYTMTMQYHATTCHKISYHTIPYLLNSIISTFGNRRKKLNN